METLSLEAPDVPGRIPSPEPLTTLFLERTRRSPHHVVTYSKVDGRWQGTTWGEVRRAVEELALGLLELGVGAGDSVAIVSHTRREWGLVDLATLAVGARTVGVYPTLTGEQTRYLLDHSKAKVVFVEDAAQLQKIVEHPPARPVHLVTFAEPSPRPTVTALSALRRTGAKRAIERPDEFERRAREAKTSDVVTYVYTSGTTGEPKGAMLTHANFHYVIHATSLLIPYDGERSLVFLPLAHSMQRYVGYLSLIADVEAYFAESYEKVPENLREVSPTVFAVVPRVLEKVYAKVMAAGRASRGVEAKLFERSIAALKHLGTLRRAGYEPGLRARLLGAAADRFFAHRIKERMGGRVKFIGCGSAPLAREVHEFFEDVGVPILEGYGLTETSAPVCLSTLRQRQIGSVGRPIPGTEIKVAADGELLVKGPGVFAGYYDNPTATREAFDDEGWFRTGDVGQISRNGFVTITDRKKDLIITAGGKNIAPQPVESRLKADPLVGQAVLIGDNRPYVTALLSLDADVLKQAAAELGLTPSRPPSELAADPRIRARIDRQVGAVNQSLPRYEQIKTWDLLPHELTVDSGELTPTLKVKRRVIHERYRDKIDAMYADER